MKSKKSMAGKVEPTVLAHGAATDPLSSLRLANDGTGAQEPALKQQYCSKHKPDVHGTQCRQVASSVLFSKGASSHGVEGHGNNVEPRKGRDLVVPVAPLPTLQYTPGTRGRGISRPCMVL